MDGHITLEFTCRDCNTGLKVEPDGFEILVEPCPECVENAYDEGKNPHDSVPRRE